MRSQTEQQALASAAICLYEKLGFRPISKPQGAQHGAVEHFCPKSL